MMDFQHEGHEACYGRVKEYMTALFGEQAWASDEAPYFEVSMGPRLFGSWWMASRMAARS